MQSPIHDAAAKGFQSASGAYERGRPEYPKDAVDKLVKVLGIGPESTLVDLAAGTGKFTRLLLPTGAKIVAVEPVEAMRRTFSSILPKIEILSGTAESIPLPNCSAEAIVVAQAFHWFNGPAALAEIHRVLKPNGKLGLIWNARDETVDWFKRLTLIYDGYEKGAPQYRHGKWKAAFQDTKLFTPLEERSFQYIQLGNIETIVDRMLSISFIAALPDIERAHVERQVRELIQSHPMTRGREKFEIPYRTDIFWCEKRNLP